MRIEEQARAPVAENVVPLINLVLLLLLFFMLVGTLSPRPPFEVEPVESERGPPADAPRDALYISADGRLYWRGAPTELVGLGAAVARVGSEVPGAPLEVVLDRRLAAEHLFPVVEALAASGIDAVRLVTLRGEAR